MENNNKKFRSKNKNRQESVSEVHKTNVRNINNVVNGYMKYGKKHKPK